MRISLEQTFERFALQGSHNFSHNLGTKMILLQASQQNVDLSLGLLWRSLQASQNNSAVLLEASG
ncbi:MAG TPA: hypothetical protein V6C95_15545 [Coleofasciculaceae cyanobacterium]